MRAVAIDGPAGAGKSTIARRTALEFGFIYVDTGALYRTVAYAVSKNGIDTADEDSIKLLLNKIKIELKFINHEQRVYLDDEDVSDKIRSSEVSVKASEVSKIIEVRQYLFALQQEIAKNNDVIMDGRDIGTVVLPNADVKIYLTATSQDRAKRRYDQLLSQGVPVDFDNLVKEIEQRDYSDMNREISPLKKADDAILVDTTGNSLEESICLLTQIIKTNLESMEKK